MISLRSDVQSVLNRFEHRDPSQVQRALEYRDFVHSHDDAVWRSCAVGHVTASALVIDAISGSVLLTLHPKVGRWLQLGGHLESSDVSLRSGALREVDEESGIRIGAISAAPVRLDRHPVPCGRNADGSVRGACTGTFSMWFASKTHPSRRSVVKAMTCAGSLPVPYPTSIRRSLP